MQEKDSVLEKDQSDFNSGIATLMRIDQIKQGLITAAIHQDYDLKWRYLRAYFFELISMMNKEDDQKQRIRFIEIRTNYESFRKAVTQGRTMISASILNSFDDWEIELRNIEQKYGLNMPKRMDARYALGGRHR